VQKEDKRLFTWHPMAMAIVISVSLIPWLFCCMFNNGYNASWIIGIVIAELGTYIVNAACFKTAPVCVEHWGERLGIFVMIHFGEAMVSLLTEFPVGAKNPNTSWEPYFGVGASLIIVFALTRVYFVIEFSEHKARHALRRNRGTATVYTVSHWILCISIITYSVSVHEVQLVIEANAGFNLSLIPVDGGKRAIFDAGNSSGFNNSSTIYKNEIYAEWFFCTSICLILAQMIVQNLLSISPNEYWVPYAQYIKAGLRAVLIILVIIVTAAHVDAASFMYINGTLFFVWIVAESFVMTKKVVQTPPNLIWS